MRDKAKGMIVIQLNNDVLDRVAPAWIELADDRLGAKVRDLPIREQIDIPIREQLIVELYSK